MPSCLQSKDRASASVPKHRHKEVVRKKEEREALRGFDCDQCKRVSHYFSSIFLGYDGHAHGSLFSM